MDRRAQSRISVHCLVKFVLGGRIHILFSRNLSALGVLLYAPEPVDLGIDLPILINVPGRASAISAVGKVQRVTKLRDLPGFEIALEFVEIAPEAKEFLSNVTMRVKGNHTS